MDAGFTQAQLQAAGFTPSELAGATLLGNSAVNKIIPDSLIKSVGCDPVQLKALRNQGVSSARIRAISGCSAAALKAAGYTAQELTAGGFSPSQLETAGFGSAEIAGAQAMLKSGQLDGSGVNEDTVKAAGCDIDKLTAFHAKGVSAARIRSISGCSEEALKKAGYNAQELLDAGFTQAQLQAAGFTPSELAGTGAIGSGLSDTSGIADDVLKTAGCDPDKLKAFQKQGVSAARIHAIAGCSAGALNKAGYNARALVGAGFTPEQLLTAGFSPEELKTAGMGISPAGSIAAGRTAGCSVNDLLAARKMGLSAKTIKNTLGCDANALKKAGYSATDLKEAGYTAAELKNSGFSAADLKTAGFNAKALRSAGFDASALKAVGYDAADLKDAGFTAENLKAAGFTTADLKKAGLSSAELKAAGFTAAELKKAGFSAAELKASGINAAELKAAGFSNAELQAAGYSSRDSALAGLSELSSESDKMIPSIDGGNNSTNMSRRAQIAIANAKKLEKIVALQKSQMADQKYQQKVQQRISSMTSFANQLMQGWKQSPNQSYVAGTATVDKNAIGAEGKLNIPGGMVNATSPTAESVIIKMGDVLFAVIDTSVNTDEPGPILATIVSGPLKGSKLIGTFNLPANAEKMVISFNSMSVPGAPKTLSISAFAIDPETARTALSSETDHHYLSRYGALFASTFLEGFGNAFQSADTSITIGGEGGVQNTTIQNGIGRSTLENAVIGLATVGKAWGQYAQQGINRKPTIEVYSGTGVGILFTQDVTIK